MFKQRLKGALAQAAVAIAASVGIAGPASAAVYTGNWDPGYGAPFGSLGWKASALFDVPDSCLALGSYTGALSGSCSSFTLLSAELDFYNYSTDPTGSNVLESFALNTGVMIYGIQIAGGQLTGVTSGFFAPVTPIGASMPIAGNGAELFSLILDSYHSAQLIYSAPGLSPICAYMGDASCGKSANAPAAVFAPIPEPETYALLLAGLGAVGFMALRRKRR